MEEVLNQEWVKKLFPDGNYPKEWFELEIKDVDKTWVKMAPGSRRPPPVYGDEFKGYSPRKNFLLKRFREVFGQEVVLVVDSLGMKSTDWIGFRGKLENTCNFKVFKTLNTLSKRSLQKTKFEMFGNLLSGGSMMWHSDSIENMKPLLSLLKKEPPGKHTILGGKIQNQLFNHEQIEQFKDIPTIDVMRGQLSAIIAEPAQRVARNIGSHPATLSRLLNSHANPPPPEEDAEDSN